MGSSKRIDPRFEALSGALDMPTVQQKYGFVYDQAKAELDAMKSTLKAHQAADVLTGKKRRKAKTRGELLDDEAFRALRSEADRRQQFVQRHQGAERERRAKSALMKAEAAAVAKGKRPFYAKSSVIKDHALIEQYTELKEGGKLGKVVTSKRKKLVQKQRKLMSRPATAPGNRSRGARPGPRALV